ncbi:MAG TPA: sigma 54-interacting transcriptional regulator [Burkholderiales bacterium]|nr:sigma 54-interacting transcriptional regulator [Burkholderiales bacterium]
MSSKARILVADDDPDILKLVSMRLGAAGYEVQQADSGERALAMFSAEQPHVVITDLKMGELDGMGLFEAIRARASTVPVIVLTAHGTIPDAVSAIQQGVFGFIPKPFDGKALVEQVERALKLSIGEGPEAGEEWRRDIISRSPAMEAVLRQAQMVARTDAGVFIHGASGTGKELLARAIHNASKRTGKPFVAVNCAAIPENLLESELFGHRKGAFTGAAFEHTGLIPASDGGTLFLDEIGDMPLALQVKLLRVLQDREVRPVGSTQAVPVDMRVISATHRDLHSEMTAGRFREDLYYRLNVVSLDLPSLAERREDIVPLAMHFLNTISERNGKSFTGFAPEAVEMLITAPWAGNVRQLMNVVEQVVALGVPGVIPASQVAQALRQEPQPLASLEEARRGFEREYLIRILRMTGGNVTQAAKLAKRNRTEFYKLLDRHSLEPKLFKTPSA